MRKYRGKRPTRIREIWSAGGHRFAKTNDGVPYWIDPAVANAPGGMPTVNDDATEHPACILRDQAEQAGKFRPRAWTTTDRDLVAQAMCLAVNARHDLGLNAGDGAKARPTVAQLNRTLERLDAIASNLGLVLK